MANETPLDNPNVQKFLDFIGKAEGADYNVIVGGKRFDDFSKHPGIVGLRTKEGPSTAAGKYQITKTTYDDFAPKLGITDFSPQSQDRIAVEIFKREKALGDIQKGDFEAAINKLGGRFASLPSSKYSQPKKSWDFVQAELGTVAQGPSSTQKMASRAQPKPFKVAQGPQAAPKAAKMALTDLPQSYRSALALNYLVDSDPEDELMAKATELLQASMPDQGGGPAGGTVLQKYAAQMPEINPYQFLQPPPTDQGPARMAAGGLVVGGTTLPFIPGASLTQEQMDLIKQRERQYEDYQAKYKEYEPLADEYSRAVDEYNRKADLYNQRNKLLGDVQYWTSNYGATPYNLGVSYSAAENRRKNQMIRDAGLKPGSSGLYDVSFFLPEDGLYEWEQTRGTPGGVIYYGDLYKRGGAYPGEFTRQAPTAPDLGFDPQQHEQYVTQAQKDAALRAQALQVASDPGRFNLSGLSAFGSAESPNPVVARRPGAIPRIPRMFAEGGEVSEEDRRKEISARIQTEKINEQLAQLLDTYRTTGTGAEQLALFTGLPVADIAAMFGASDTNLPSAEMARENQLGEFRETTPKVMTDEGTRLRPGYELRSVPKDMTSPDSGHPLIGRESMEDWLRRKQIQRSGVNPRTQMFANGGEVTGEELFQQMIGGTPSPLQITPQVPVPMPTPRQSEVPQLDQFGRVVRDPVAPAPQRTVLQELIGAGEAAATVGTGVLSAVPAALVGAKELLTPGQTRQGAEAAMMGTMDRFTYTPKGEAGRENLDNLGKFLQATKLDAALPQTQLLSMRVNPGAARYLGERAREGTEAAVLPGLRAQTQNPELQATDVYGAMLSPSETIKAGVVPAMPKTPVQRIERDSFVNATEELDKIPTTPEVEQVLSAHIGGVGNFGDPDAKYYLRQVPGGPEYTQQAQNVAQKYFGDQFMGYRLMPKEEFEALKVGDVGDLLSFSLSKDAANAFRRFAPNQGREDLVLAEVPLTPSHVLGFGHRGEQEVIVDTSVGWSMDAFRRARPSLTPSEDFPFIGELERRVADLPGPIKKQTLIGMLKGRPHDIRRAKEALEDFGSNDEIEPDQIMSALRRTSPQRYRLEVTMPTDKNQKSMWASHDNPYPNRPMGTVNLLLESGKTEKKLNSLFEDVEEFRSNRSASSIFRNPKNLEEYLGEIDKFADRVEEFDPQLAARTKMLTSDTAAQVKPLVNLSTLRSYVTTPILDPKNKWLVDWNDLEKTVPQEVKDLLQSRGVTNITPAVATIAAKELAARNYLKEFNNVVTSGKLYLPRSIVDFEKQSLSEMSSSPEGFLDAANNFKYYYEEMDKYYAGNERVLMDEISTNLNSVLGNLDNVLAVNKNAIISNVRELSQYLLDSDTLRSAKPYEGKHQSIVKANPISFSRFVEIQPQDFVPARPQSAVLFTELQSDRRGAVKGLQKGVEEPYPSFVEDADLLRELMMKSAVAGAAKLGKNIALFPGADSNRPELYGTWKTQEAKDKKDRTKYYPTTMKRIAEKVAKDLGEGYEAMEFYVRNAQGEPIARWGIVIPDDAAQTLPKKGIGFFKGGLVDRSLYDRA